MSIDSNDINATPMEMSCEHGTCQRTDGRDYVNPKCEAGWEGEPIFLCNKHSKGYTPVLETLIDKYTQTTTVAEAVDILVKALQEDPEYRRAWKANIAMAFQDEFYNDDNAEDVENFNIHPVANKAADRFLDMLINTKQ